MAVVAEPAGDVTRTSPGRPAGPAGGARTKAIAFRVGGTPLAEALLRGAGGCGLRLAGRLRVDRYRNREQASFQIEDAVVDA